jgi:hypothetical protein
MNQVAARLARELVLVEGKGHRGSYLRLSYRRLRSGHHVLLRLQFWGRQFWKEGWCSSSLYRLLRSGHHVWSRLQFWRKGL